MSGLFISIFGCIILFGVFVYSSMMNADLTDTQLFMKYWPEYVVGIVLCGLGMYLAAKDHAE